MSFSAISLLIHRQLKENAKLYGMGIGVLAAFLAFMFLIVHQWKDSFSGAVQNGVFIIGLFISGGLFTQSMFQEFSSTPSSIWFLSIPVKHAEKLAGSIILSVIFFLVGYLLIFYAVDIAYLFATAKFSFNVILNPFKDGFYQVFFLYLLFNGIVLLGSVVFKKHSFIKTLLASILFFILFNTLNNLILEFLIPEMSVVSSVAFDSFQFVHLGENIKVFLPEQAELIGAVFVRGILPISIWFIVWLKLKEKEV